MHTGHYTRLQWHVFLWGVGESGLKAGRHQTLAAVGPPSGPLASTPVLKVVESRIAADEVEHILFFVAV